MRSKSKTDGPHETVDQKTPPEPTIVVDEGADDGSYTQTVAYLSIKGETAMPGIAATVLQLVDLGHTPERACSLCAAPIGQLWSGCIAKEIEADPTALPVDRAILRALGYDVPSELPLAVALGMEPAAPAETEEA